MKISFERLEDGRWYVVFPEYEGPQEDLEMVEDADDMLDALTTDGLYVTLDITMDVPAGDDYFTLEMEAHDDDGAFYNVADCQQFSGIVWLCNVTHQFFDDHPQKLFCKLCD